ncbi:MAG: hypothetical protein M1833_001447 [Piccolia ochrophora]|nr:MAG: hypothetical protein M1833_001447 [Piccolia ochrophora]
MPTLRNIVVRDDSNSDGDMLSPTMLNLLIALLVLLFIALLLGGALLALRSHRRSKKQSRLSTSEHTGSKSSNHRRLTITAAPYGRNSQSVHVYSEKANLVQNSSSPPGSPDSIPEIRVTFPEEVDDGGRSKSGRVVVVRVGETGVGLEPLKDEKLPPYEQRDATRFQSIDLERIGGLKEKEAKSAWS